MLIDFHTHAFPDEISSKAMDKLSYASGGLVPQTNGTVSSLKQEMAKEAVDISVVLSIATNPKQQRNVNNYAKEINDEKSIFAFYVYECKLSNFFSEISVDAKMMYMRFAHS